MFIVPGLVWAAKKGAKKAAATLDEKIQLAATARIEELKQTLVAHIDRKFVEHDECDQKILGRLERIESALIGRHQ